MAGQQQPIFIMREGTSQTKGKAAQSNNIMAAKAVAEAVRTTLGPKGMDKMLVDSMGDIIITNDGATILREMDIEHPAAKMIVEVSKTQDDEVGDGTTTAAVLAGELLKVSEQLLEQDVHPTMITAGFRLAAEKAAEVLDGIAIDVSDDDDALLENIAGTAITGKGAEGAKEHLSKLVVKAVKSIVEETNGKVKADITNIKVEKRVGGSIDDSEIIDGIIIDKERVHTNMPRKVDNANILLLTAPIEVRDTEVDAEISITSPDQLQLFLDEEERMLKEIVDKVAKSGANVVFCQKGIEDMAQHYLAKAGIFAMRRITKADMDKISKATGARLVTKVDEIKDIDIGHAASVEERKIGGGVMTYISGCKNLKAVSLLLRGGTEHVVTSLERALHDALKVVGVILEDKKFVAGGGSPEVELTLRLKEYAATLTGREQLAVEKFATALEVIPRTLAENAGLDPIDTLVELRSKHEQGNKNAGLNVYTGKVIDMLKEGVVEPLRVKTQAINSATESAVMILRIDDVLASTRAPPMPEGGGMGGMPPGMGGMGMPPGMGGMM